MKEPSATFLDHTLAVAQLAIDLMVAERRVNVISDAHTAEEDGATDDGHFEITVLQPEPQCWRRYQMGLAGIEVLKPDLFVAIGSGEYEDRWFIEVDRGTESTTAVVRKCRVYVDYYRVGAEQQKHDVVPKVLWIVPSEHRKLLIERAIAKARELRGLNLFVVVQTNDALGMLIGGAS